MTMEQVVTQLQQEVFNLRAQVAAESVFADAVRAINNLVTAQFRKETPSLIDVEGLGRPKEFPCKEEDFPHLSKKTEAFFAGVIMESEMLLEWAAGQPKEITMTAIDLEFLPTDANKDGCMQNLEFVLQQMHTALMALTSCEANDIVANSLNNPWEAWRRLQKRYDPTTRGRKRNLLHTIISPQRCSLLELHAGIERWESYVSRYEKKMKDKERVKRTMKNPKHSPRVPKAHARVKHRKTSISGLENLKSETNSETPGISAIGTCLYH